MVEKFMLFRQWWHTIFADWNAARLPSYFAWMIPDSQVPYVPGYVADAMLVIFGCMILSTLLTLVQFRKGKVRFMALVKLGSIPIAALGLLGLFFASNLFETVFMDLRVTAIEAVTAAIVASNDATVDSVAGATLTSNRIMNAVAACLEQAAK